MTTLFLQRAGTIASPARWHHPSGFLCCCPGRQPARAHSSARLAVDEQRFRHHLPRRLTNRQALSLHACSTRCYGALHQLAQHSAPPERRRGRMVRVGLLGDNLYAAHHFGARTRAIRRRSKSTGSTGVANARTRRRRTYFYISGLRLSGTRRIDTIWPLTSLTSSRLSDRRPVTATPETLMLAGAGLARPATPAPQPYPAGRRKSARPSARHVRGFSGHRHALPARREQA